MFAAGWIGGGDAKLAAATALWLGFEHLTTYLLYASLMGGALTLLLLRYRREPMPGLLVRQEWAVHLHSPSTGVPYGIALAAAALLLYPQSVFMRAIGL
jgi:prepilin peptidase CpaA